MKDTSIYLKPVAKPFEMPAVIDNKDRTLIPQIKALMDVMLFGSTSTNGDRVIPRPYFEQITLEDDDRNRSKYPAHNINVNTAAATLEANVSKFVTNYLRVEDFICAVFNTGELMDVIPQLQNYLSNNCATIYGYPSNYIRLDSYTLGKYALIVRFYWATFKPFIALYNAMVTTSHSWFFSFGCNNISDKTILWIWQILGRMKNAPVDEIANYPDYSTLTANMRLVNYSTDKTAWFYYRDYHKHLDTLIDFVRNRYKDLILKYFDDLNPPAFTNMRTFALARKTNISAGSNKKLQVNNNQIIKICQGENTILDLTN